MFAKILLVDPDISNRTDWEALLTNFGYKVSSVDNGKAALARCVEIQPDFVLIEGPLPDITGAEVARQLKSDPLTQLTPVVLILTGAIATDPSRSALQDVDDFWMRPTSRWEAVNRIQSLVHMRTYIDQQAESVAYSLARSIDAKDSSSVGHSDRVREYGAQLGTSIELSEDELSALRMASLVHDVGKVAVPDSILFKPSSLTPRSPSWTAKRRVVGWTLRW